MNNPIKNWICCTQAASLSCGAEVFLARLYMAADGNGTFYADPRLLRSQLYALKVDVVSEADVQAWLDECLQAGLADVFWYNNTPYVTLTGYTRKLSRKNVVHPVWEKETSLITEEVAGHQPKEAQLPEKAETEAPVNPSDDVQDEPLIHALPPIKDVPKPIRINQTGQPEFADFALSRTVYLAQFYRQNHKIPPTPDAINCIEEVFKKYIPDYTPNFGPEGIKDTMHVIDCLFQQAMAA